MIAPNDTQLRILRLMNAGAELRAPERPTGCFGIYIGTAQIGIVRNKTMKVLVDAGWIQFDSNKSRWVIGHSGRAHAEVGAFVRAFSETA